MSDESNRVSKTKVCLIGLGAVILLGLFGTWLWYVCCVGFVDNFEYGYTYNKFTGQIEPVEHNGWVVVNPWVKNLHKKDLRPHQVSINISLGNGSSANKRILNAKLVRFNPEGIKTFVEWHGRDAGDNVTELMEILKCYAFDRDDGKDCPFLTVVNELAPSQSVPQTPSPKVVK